MNGLPELPTWAFPKCELYYDAQGANQRLQDMEQEFNNNRIKMNQYVAAAIAMLGEKDRVINEQTIEIENLQELVAELRGD